MMRFFLVSVDVGSSFLTAAEVYDAVAASLIHGGEVDDVHEVDENTAYQVREAMDNRWR